MAATLREVAQRAGVSIRTVSNVVNDFPRVAPETRERVQRALDEMGYRPNAAARTLRRGRSGLIALVLPELDVPYFADLARVVIEHATAAGYTVIIDQTDGDPDRERDLITRGSRQALFDGMIFSPLALSDADLRDRPSTVPIVLLGERVTGHDLDHVGIDNVAAARLATEHLIGIGRQRIAAIGDQPGEAHRTAHLRTQGFTGALRDAGMPCDPGLIRTTSFFHRADGAAAMADLLALDTPPDAVFCYNDLLALGALRTMLRAGVRVPEDIALIGFDDIEDGRYSTPTLTTVGPDKSQIAEYAVRCLLARLGGDDQPPQDMEARFRLMARESTAG